MIVLASLPDSDTIVVVPTTTEYCIQNKATEFKYYLDTDTELIQRLYQAHHDTNDTYKVSIHTPKE